MAQTALLAKYKDSKSQRNERHSITIQTGTKLKRLNIKNMKKKKNNFITGLKFICFHRFTSFTELLHAVWQYIFDIISLRSCPILHLFMDFSPPSPTSLHSLFLHLTPPPPIHILTLSIDNTRC